MRGLRAELAGGLVLATVFAMSDVTAWAGPAVNQFEVKDLQSAPGEIELQSQNAWSTGQPRRKSVAISPGERIYDDNSVTRQREALEVQLGVTDWLRLRVGVEFEQERLDDPALFSQADQMGSLKFDEVALEGVIVFIKPKKEGVGLGLLVEYGAPINDAEAPAELYLGPIIEAHTGNWTAIANLAFVRQIGGQSLDPDFVADEKWDFAYFTQLKYDVSRNWGLAFEAYGTFDRLGNSGAPGEERAYFGDHDQHRAGPIVYYTFFPNVRPLAQAVADKADGDDTEDLSVSIGTGVLFGLNENTPDATYKLSLEVEY